MFPKWDHQKVYCFSQPHNTTMTVREELIEVRKRLDGTLTLDQLFPLLNMSRKGVQKALDRLKVKEILTREGSTKAGRWIVNENP